MRRETSRVSFLMCPFCVRQLSPNQATRVAIRWRSSPSNRGGSATIAVGTHGVGRWVRGFENDLRLHQTFLLFPLFHGSESRTA
jgi:hypothetical protein